MIKSIICLFLSLFLIGTLSSCDDSQHDNKTLSNTISISILVSPNSLGDNGYNDLIFSGLTLFYINHPEISIHLLLPDNMAEADSLYKDWLKHLPPLKPAILLVASNEYQSIVEKSTPMLNDGQRILGFEFINPQLPDGVCSFYINRYGASYLAGAMSAAFNAQIIAAMPGDSILKEAINGFTAGHQSHGNMSLTKSYLSSNSSGYAMPDSAYHWADGKYDCMIYPLIGGSSTGVLRYINETNFSQCLMVGMDKNQNDFSHRILFSQVLNIDKLVYWYLQQYIEGYEWKQYATYGLSEGFTDIICDTDYVKYLDIWDERYDNDSIFVNLYNKYKQEAISKEIEYEKAINN